MYRKFVLVLLVSFQLLCIAAIGKAQAPADDTLRLTIKEAESRFIKNNLTVIAQHYNIDNADAQVITARLFPNPDFNFTNGIYNDTHDAYKEQSVAVSQLFYTAGKRNKNIQLAKIGVAQAKYQFFDIVRTLRFTLRNDFYNIYYQEQSARVYDEEIKALNTTFTAYKEQYAKGNIAQKELLRIQSQLYSLKAEYNSLQINIDTLQSEFKMLIRVEPRLYIAPFVDTNKLNQHVTDIAYQRFLDSAYVNRNDLKYAKATVDYNNMNLDLQKANARPDINLSVGYDKFGAFNTNYVNGGIEFNLPFFNRNQGNIKAARVAIEQSKVQYQQQQDQIASDLTTSYKGALRYEQLYNGLDPAFNKDFDHLVGEVLKNYQRRNISLLEFLDFYDAYKSNVLQYNNILFGRISSLEQINYVTGTSFFNN